MKRAKARTTRDLALPVLTPGMAEKSTVAFDRNVSANPLYCNSMAIPFWLGVLQERGLSSIGTAQHV
jgi:hypothetical protein